MVFVDCVRNKQRKGERMYLSHSNWVCLCTWLRTLTRKKRNCHILIIVLKDIQLSRMEMNLQCTRNGAMCIRMLYCLRVSQKIRLIWYLKPKSENDWLAGSTQRKRQESKNTAWKSITLEATFEMWSCATSQYAYYDTLAYS